MIFYLILDEKRNPQVVEPCNTHEKDNTDIMSATSHVNSNKELELTCDTSPRIIIHNSDNTHENNNHIGCAVNHVATKINNSNHKFTDRIEQLSTAVGQLEKLLDGNSSEFSAVDGQSDQSLDGNDQTTIQCDNFIQSDHVKSIKDDPHGNNHVTNSCQHVTENCAGNENSCDTLDTVVDTGEQTSNVKQEKITMIII